MGKQTGSQLALQMLYAQEEGVDESLNRLRMAVEVVAEYSQATEADQRLRHVQYIAQLSRDLPTGVLASIASTALPDADPRIRGEMCHALGQSGSAQFIPELQALVRDDNPWVRTQAEMALQQLEDLTPSRSDYEALAGRVERLVEQMKVQGSGLSKRISRILAQLSHADPDEIQFMSAKYHELLFTFYEAVLGQARASFVIAGAAAIIGVIFFLVAAGFLTWSDAGDAATVTIVAGAIVEVISGIGFLLYTRATGQMRDFHRLLDRTQRYLLANGICEALKGTKKHEARAELVAAMSSAGLELPEARQAGGEPGG
jgi:hypothetical protein